MAIVACPGGAYWTLAMGHEGHDMADWFNSQGITYAVLRYRMPNGHKEVPLSDSQQALRIMRQHAQEWNVKKLGIMGSSAGGHLPAPQPLISPMRKPVRTSRFCSIRSSPWTLPTLTCSHDNLLGKNPSKELEQKYSNELQVTPQTPPASSCTAAMTQ